MTWPLANNHNEGWTAAAANGCTGTTTFGLACRSQQTVVMDGIRGRRCLEHAPPEAADLIAHITRHDSLQAIDSNPRHAWLRIHLPNLIGRNAA